MPSRSTIWLRDAFVIIFAIYVVVSIAMVPWSNLKMGDSVLTTCPTGCPPIVNFPENNYHHYDDSLIFDWDGVSVTYNAIIKDLNNETVHEVNLTNINSTTSSRLKEGNYTSTIFYKGIWGSNISRILVTDNHVLDSSSKITLQWASVNVTYTLQIREYKETEVPIIHEVSGLIETFYEYSDFKEGNEYAWSVFAVDDFDIKSEASSQYDLRIGTTKFLAFMLFNEWELPFLLLGVMMVIALQAGVFLAREEKDD